MAVKKKYKNKKNNKKILENNEINKKEEIKEEVIDSEIEEFIVDNTDNSLLEDNKLCINANGEEILEKQKNKRSYKPIVILSILIIISSLMVVFFPKIELLGEEYMTISYKDSYLEPGYNASSYDKDISSSIYIDNNIIDGVLGEYEVNYYIDLFGARLKKTRYVNIVDQEKPVIEVDSDTINICPNQEQVPDVSYRSIDEYDGDITNLVLKKVNDKEIVLSVSDSSNNYVSKIIKINRGDQEEPVIKLKGSSIMFVEYGNKYIEPGYEVSDNCSDSLSDKVKVSGSVGKNIGKYTLTYEVSDDSGNKSSVTRKIIVGSKIVDNGIINNGTIYLTFDDGPNEGTTNKILDILKDKGIKATFFVTNRGPDRLIKRMNDEGHTVALHTATHEYGYIYSSVDNYFNDLNKVGDRVKRITGVDSKIIRFPGGSSNTISRNYKEGIMTELTSLVINEGYRYFDWNVDAMDASSARNADDVYYNVVSNLSINKINVVLMHDTKSITANALSDIIDFGKKNGYKFSNIDMNTYMIRHGVNN